MPTPQDDTIALYGLVCLWRVSDDADSIWFWFGLVWFRQTDSRKNKGCPLDDWLTDWLTLSRRMSTWMSSEDNTRHMQTCPVAVHHVFCCWNESFLGFEKGVCWLKIFGMFLFLCCGNDCLVHTVPLPASVCASLYFVGDDENLQSIVHLKPEVTPCLKIIFHQNRYSDPKTKHTLAQT